MKFVHKELSDLYIVKDGTHDSPKYVNPEIGFPLVTSKNLRNGFIDLSVVDFISKEDYENINKRSKVDKGDLLFAMIGTIGNPVHVLNEPNYAIKNVALFKKNKDNNSIEYLKYILTSISIKRKLSRDATGGTQKFVSLSYIRKLIIPIPEKIEDQLHIANILSKAENLVAQRKESIRLLDEFLKSTFLEMFGDPQRNEMGWKKLTMNDISIQITDGEHTTPQRTSTGIKLLSARNIKDSYLDFNAGLDFIGTSEFERISKRCNPEKGDVLMSCSGSVGRVCVIDVNEPLSLVRSVALIKLKRSIVHPIFAQSWMQTRHFQNEVKRGAKTSSQSNIFTGAIKKLSILLPPIELQTQFAQIVEKTEVLKEQYKNSLQELENLYGSLSQRAFSINETIFG